MVIKADYINVKRPRCDGAESMDLASSNKEYLEYMEKEHKFMLNQCIERSRLRIQQKRALPVDIIIAMIFDDFDYSMDISEFNILLSRCTNDQLKDSLEVVSAYRQVGMVKSVDVSRILDSLENIIQYRLQESNAVLHVSPQVLEKIDSILSSRTVEQLEQYQVEIRRRFDINQVMDTNFWEATLSRIPFFKSIKTIQEIISTNNGLSTRFVLYMPCI